MIDAYAAVSVYVDRLPELEEKISAAFHSVCQSRAGFDSFNEILGRGFPRGDQWVRYVAWISQHAFGNRAHCVGNKILLKRGGHFESPLVQQLAYAGYEPYVTEFPTSDAMGGGANRALTQIDCMVVDRPSDQVFLVKGLVFESATRGAKRESATNLPLFAPIVPDAARLFVRPRKVACLAAAHDVVRAAFPRLRITPVVLVVDDIYMGWHFQAFDLSSAMRSPSGSKTRCLGDFDRITSSEQLASDLDELQYLPAWAVKDPLNALPVDRATRCLAILNLIWLKQRELRNRLAVLRATEITQLVNSQYKIEYPSDLRRHDLEDCLERGGLIERPGFEGNSFALSPKGVARLLLMKRLFAGNLEIEDEDDVRSHMLSHVHKQSTLWARYRDGQAVCA